MFNTHITGNFPTFSVQKELMQNEDPICTRTLFQCHRANGFCRLNGDTIRQCPFAGKKSSDNRDTMLFSINLNLALHLHIEKEM